MLKPQNAIPRLIGLSTAVPPHRIEQKDIADAARLLFNGKDTDFDRLMPVYTNAGIETRYSCVPLNWFSEKHGWAERSRIYTAQGLNLIQDAATKCLSSSNLHPEDIDGIVIVSTTGVTTPSLDALLLERMPFRRNTHRLPIFGLGCAGGVLGLGRTAALAQAEKEKIWLLIVVELCGLTFRKDDLSKSNIIASALFGDGAAAVIVSCTGNGPEIRNWGEHTWKDSLNIMGWKVEDDGFGVLFSRNIPTLVRNRLKSVAEDYLKTNGQKLNEIDHYVFHPGGAKVIDAISSVFSLSQTELKAEREILREFGNMSAASIFFVLERILKGNATGTLLLSALGPGFTAAFSTLRTNS